MKLTTNNNNGSAIIDGVNFDSIQLLTEEIVRKLEELTKKKFSDNCFAIIGTDYPAQEVCEMVQRAAADCLDYLDISTYVIDNFDELTTEDGIDMLAVADVADAWAEVDDDFQEDLFHAVTTSKRMALARDILHSANCPFWGSLTFWLDDSLTTFSQEDLARDIASRFPDLTGKEEAIHMYYKAAYEAASEEIELF